MSLLLKALQQAERGSDLSLEPMEPRVEAPGAPPASAKAAAALMLDKQAHAEKRRMLILLGILAAVVIGMGVYFYLAVFMPWVFLPKPAPITAPPAVVSAASAPVVAEAEPVTTPVSSAPALVPAPVAPEAVLAPKAVVSAAKPVTTTNKPVAPIVIKETPGADAPVQISSGSKIAPSSGVQAAYQLLESGRLEEARRAYEAMRAQEPQNSDVLLGLGLIAQRQGRSDDAAKFYLKALDLDPKNAFAQASLSAMIARADPAAAEKKLQALITQQPGAAFLHFRLGNILAAQGRWNEAQKAYFEAQRLESDSPDYAFNLAISLERIQQPRAALEYYQRALRLAQNKPASFDVGQAKARLQALGAAN